MLLLMGNIFGFFFEFAYNKQRYVSISVLLIAYTPPPAPMPKIFGPFPLQQSKSKRIVTDPKIDPTAPCFLLLLLAQSKPVSYPINDSPNAMILFDSQLY